VEPQTHYQISVTARQAVGLFVGLLLALGLAFFFGLMTGLAGRRHETERRPASELADASPAAEPAAGVEGRGEAAERETPVAAASAEPTAPPTLQTFEDGGAEAPLPPIPVTAKPVAAAPAPKSAAAKPPAAAGRVWVQVASVSNRPEADALSARLAKRGYHTAVAAEKGRLRVRVGPYRTTEDARAAAEALRRNEKIKNPWVVFEGK
jgi:cell division protein FtsN